MQERQKYQPEKFPSIQPKPFTILQITENPQLKLNYDNAVTVWNHY